VNLPSIEMVVNKFRKLDFMQKVEMLDVLLVGETPEHLNWRAELCTALRLEDLYPEQPEDEEPEYAHLGR